MHSGAQKQLEAYLISYVASIVTNVIVSIAVIIITVILIIVVIATVVKQTGKMRSGVKAILHSGANLGGRQRSRLSVGGRALGTPPDPTLVPRPLHAAPPTPPLPAPHPPSARAGPQPAALPQGSEARAEAPHRGLTVPYTQRLQTAGVATLLVHVLSNHNHRAISHPYSICHVNVPSCMGLSV